MNATRPAEILRQLEQPGATDAELLAHFATTKDAAAFELLVRRHGALVLGVCRRVTRNAQDAEDAFQATFLVLAQKAHSLRNAALLGNWLYGVAFRVAWRARRSAARRSTREVTMSNLPDYPAPAQLGAMPELAPILDEELAALAECYREAIVLCDLRGASREEAATALGIPEGTLSSRLANGRKKLAARLTKRGIALSVAILPVAVSEMQAATVLPNELLTKTCGLIADYSVGGAVRGPLAKLAKGGLTVRQTLVFGLVTVAVVTGAVFAARPGDAPPDAPPKPPVVAEKPEPVPQPKVEPKLNDNAFTTEPKMQRSFDLYVSDPTLPMWNVTGTHLAVSGSESVGPAEAKKTRAIVWLLGVSPNAKRMDADPSAAANLIAVAPDGTGVVTDLREYNLISGHHSLDFWGARPPGGFVGVSAMRPADLVTKRTVELDPKETHGYAFASDWKTYRTVAYHRDIAGSITKLEVVEADATTGKLGKSFLKFDPVKYTLSPNGTRLAVFDEGETKVTIFDVDRGVKISDYPLPTDKSKRVRPGPGYNRSHIVFSQDGKRLLVSWGIGRSKVLETDTGKALPDLEGAATGDLLSGMSTFTGDGRLLAAVCQTYKATTRQADDRRNSEDWVPGMVVLVVWDTQTGKALKTWPASKAKLAFCPTKPLLAILEPHGSETRVGFWDFTAEEGKK
ncbi:RNA polymerase sigma factor [Gemmata sp. G18]|uniref:RNA polymerase sigma factor n=1 Tax=Gemmata palustris TaxID=2822762 RepID=A0ABS5BKD7_9BACT|nr:RNA polymerase sigma factor [Gemmata palustris]MBP3954149.1 RNA polymerase sigma factor [Gemmata palustris]